MQICKEKVAKYAIICIMLHITTYLKKKIHFYDIPNKILNIFSKTKKKKKW
jgi:hypothetical protein